MATKIDRTTKLLRAVRRQLRRRAKESTKGLGAAYTSLSYLAWLARYCRDFAALPSFLDAVGSDIVAIHYACAAGLERTAYLHSRSLLENLVRHCYFDSRPALFVARHLEPEESVHDKWAELIKEIHRLPHFHPALAAANEDADEEGLDDSEASAEEDASGGESSIAAPSGPTESAVGRSPLFRSLLAVYSCSSRFVHGSTPAYRSLHESVQSIGLDEPKTRALARFLRETCEAGMLFLALYHLGPYLLISQPIRRYMLLDGMRGSARRLFLRCLAEVSLTWATHHRKAALATLGARTRKPVRTRDGLVLHRGGKVLIASPR